ncbi:glycoside hydrolase family 3 protein [Plantibacter sp. Mn2098]|uniref:glycoside hydrolase family 3 protein n=1 Tax=Plantibacter sp. Mn2098 TaxID=3395266 RepID=UPI003BE354AA
MDEAPANDDTTAGAVAADGTIDPDVARLVRGVLWPGFLGRTAPAWLLRELDGGLAGVVYFGQNIGTDPAETAALSATLRAHQPSILIGVDEEGGNVSRLEALTGSTLPGHAQLGALDDVEVTKAVGVEIARRLREAGTNIALAPVADVNTNPLNPVIGNRAFGSTGALVARHTAALVEGLQSAGVAACVKHYPGHGDTATDSHLSLPRIELPLDEIDREHQPPFQAAIDAGTASIMTAHIVVPALRALRQAQGPDVDVAGDALRQAQGPEGPVTELVDVPATLNPTILGRLRATGFDGVIISDALDMAAIRSTVGSGNGAVLALRAGVDLLCIGNPSNLGPKLGATTDEDDYLEVFEAVCAAVADGSLDRGIVERAAARVQRLVVELADVPLPAARSFAEEIAQVVQVAGDVVIDAAALTILDLRNRPTFAVASAADPFVDALSERYTVTRVPVGESIADGDDEALDAALDALDETHGVIVVTDQQSIAGAQSAAAERIAARRPDAVLVGVGLRATLPTALASIDTLAASRLSADRVRDLVSAQ